MAVEVEKRSESGTGNPGENPLVPHAKLRSIYLGMRDGCLLERELERGKRLPRRSKTARNEVACRASTLLALEPGDLICAPAPTPIMEILLGADPAAIIAHPRKRAPDQSPTHGTPHWITVEDGADRLRLVAGAAMALKAQAKGRALLVFIRLEEARAAAWRGALQLAASQTLPILFVALPETPDAKPSGLSFLSEKLRVPGIAVDAYDCVAIYRVASEALLRARTGGGPALLDAISTFPGAPRRRLPDSIALLEQSLLARNVVSEAWMRDTEAAFLKRLAQAAPTKASPPQKPARAPKAPA